MAASHNTMDARAPLRGKRVVICEDMGMSIMQYGATLSAAGLDVVGIAVNGQEAIEMVLEEKPDFVLMDINMPVINGIEAVRRILSSFPTRIIMITAYSDEQHLEEALSAGAVGYIVKPVSGADLLASLYDVSQDRPTDRMVRG